MKSEKTSIALSLVLVLGVASCYTCTFMALVNERKAASIRESSLTNRIAVVSAKLSASLWEIEEAKRKVAYLTNELHTVLVERVNQAEANLVAARKYSHDAAAQAKQEYLRTMSANGTNHTVK